MASACHADTLKNTEFSIIDNLWFRDNNMNYANKNTIFLISMMNFH